jgi:hypothetical protein
MTRHFVVGFSTANVRRGETSETSVPRAWTVTGPGNAGRF